MLLQNFIIFSSILILDHPDLNNHVKTVHGVDGVVCPHCSKVLAKKCTLSRHIEQVHLNLQIHKPAKCEECGKVFSKKGHLDRHIKTIHMGKCSVEICVRIKFDLRSWPKVHSTDF